MKTVTIEIPDDSELIKEGNIYKICQVIPKTWEEFCNRTPIKQEYFIGYDSKINLRENKGRTPYGDRNLHASEVEAEATLALMQLRQLRKAWVGDWEIKYDWNDYHCIINHKNNIIVARRIYTNGALSFPTEEIAEDFLNCFKDLCETAKMLL